MIQYNFALYLPPSSTVGQKYERNQSTLIIDNKNQLQGASRRKYN